MEEIVTGDAVVLDLPSARIPSRMLARALDMLIQLVALSFILGVADGSAGLAGAGNAVIAAITVTVMVLVIVGYPVTFETLSRGRTIGKMAAGQRVVSDDGGPVRFRQALVRALAGFVECWMLIGVPALITSLSSTRGKRLGDVFSGTFVLRERTQPSLPVPWGPPLHDPVLAGWVRSLDLSALPAPLAASASGYLARYWQLNQRSREELGWQLAARVAGHVSPPAPPGIMSAAYLSIVMSERRARDLARLAAAAPPPPPPPAPPAGGRVPGAMPVYGVTASGEPAWGFPIQAPPAPGTMPGAPAAGQPPTPASYPAPPPASAPPPAPPEPPEPASDTPGFAPPE